MVITRDTARGPARDHGHGRIGTRVATVASDIDWLIKVHKWPGLKAVGKVERTREVGGKSTSETAYYLLSAPLTPERLNEVVRSHWGVENRLHWRLDVIMDEDQAGNRKDHGPENLALLRKLVLYLPKLEPTKASLRGKLKPAGWDKAFLAQIPTQVGNLQIPYPVRPAARRLPNGWPRSAAKPPPPGVAH